MRNGWEQSKSGTEETCSETIGLGPEMMVVESGETEKWTGAMDIYEVESTRFGVCFEKVGWRCF